TTSAPPLVRQSESLDQRSETTYMMRSSDGGVETPRETRTAQPSASWLAPKRLRRGTSSFRSVATMKIDVDSSNTFHQGQSSQSFATSNLRSRRTLPISRRCSDDRQVGSAW